MNWVDYVTLGVMAFVTLVFTLRGRTGMGAALFDMCAFVVAVWAAHNGYRKIANLTHLNLALTYIIIYVIVVVLLLFVAAKLYALTQMNFAPFDFLVSIVLGFIAAWAIAYALLEVVGTLAGPNGGATDALLKSSVAAEVLKFKTLTGTTGFLDRVRFGPTDTGQQ